MRSWCDFTSLAGGCSAKHESEKHETQISLITGCWLYYVRTYIPQLEKPCSKQASSFRLMARECPHSFSNHVCLLFSAFGNSWIYNNSTVLFLASLHERFPLTFTRLSKAGDGSTAGHDKDRFGTADDIKNLSRTALERLSTGSRCSMHLI